MSNQVSIGNAIKNKKLLAQLRSGDFAHPGEVEAIEYTLRDIAKDHACAVLDAGCGLGGTAQYVQEQGFGKVTAVDIDPETVEYAKAHHKNMDFQLADLCQVSSVLKQKFDLIYSFSVLYAIREKAQALTELHKIAKDDAKLVIFDYVIYADRVNSYSGSAHRPFLWDEIHDLFAQCGWRVTQQEDISVKYRIWYETLCNNIFKMREALIREHGEDAYQVAEDIYKKIYADVISGNLGGAIISAERA
jgi:SAM-dependent methyltransferase